MRSAAWLRAWPPCSNGTYEKNKTLIVLLHTGAGGQVQLLWTLEYSFFGWWLNSQALGPKTNLKTWLSMFCTNWSQSSLPPTPLQHSYVSGKCCSPISLQITELAIHNSSTGVIAKEHWQPMG